MSEHYHYTWSLDENLEQWGKPPEYKNISSSQTNK